MKTKVGQQILESNSANMDKLNARIIEIAEELKSKKKVDLEVILLLGEVRANREQHDKLQEEINTLCYVEQWVK